MNETQGKLLEKGVAVLPNHISHEVYEYVLEALAMRPEQIVMYCKGDGGDVSSALAIVDLIQQHGNVVGLLPGEANSSHATVFAGCKERYVFPNGVIGVHQIAWDRHEGRLDSHNLRLLSVDFDAADAQVAEILASASNKSRDWWYRVLRDTGSGGVTQYRAGYMMQIGLARDVGEWKLSPDKPSPPAPLPHGEGSKAEDNPNEAVPARTWTSQDALKNL
jgi:ATP-dependent protease ClpP protease subunit